ncbi:hypothetical protein [Candidatus Galacturonibacter soehngenii]|uniref:Uncharacterized protein n=1 Tax=Candidatus Galacturonatibacter soehngenii TaxID=2307010 RepID=A0A7V7QHB2_9FIRM|nr:hypothetical protein [Candidatus Galacturonibacter soehngenii]KAB1434309.1 hypothetical protein F7O84_17625 [Candidatus Galacturonibacter soehngenii]
MYKLNFKISLNTSTNLNRYASSLNLPIQTIIRFLLTEQLHSFEFDKPRFKDNYENCKFKDTFGTSDYYGKVKKPKQYSMKVSEYIYNGVCDIKKIYETKTNIVVNNLIHIGIAEKLASFDIEYATQYNDILPNTKQYAIPLSEQFTNCLQSISNLTGIKTNQLISLIIGNYLIEHFSEYDDNIYVSSTGKITTGIW